MYATGRSSGAKRSEMNRPETIEETAALVTEAGGRGIPYVPEVQDAGKPADVTGYR